MALSKILPFILFIRIKYIYLSYNLKIKIMDAKITLSFDKQIIEKAKRYAVSQNISLSRLMEHLLDKITSNQYQSLEDFPVADWVNSVAEGKTEYITSPKKRLSIKDEYKNRKK